MRSERPWAVHRRSPLWCCMLALSLSAYAENTSVSSEHNWQRHCRCMQYSSKLQDYCCYVLTLPVKEQNQHVLAATNGSNTAIRFMPYHCANAR